MEGNMTTMRNSGDRFFIVENATGDVSATFHKEDGSRHELVVEIYKDGQSLLSATELLIVRWKQALPLRYNPFFPCHRPSSGEPLTIYG